MIRAITKRMKSSEPTQVPMPEEPRKAHAVKDTKRWCRGRVGTEHVEQWRVDTSVFRAGVSLVCETCGKQLAWDWGGGTKLLLKRVEARLLTSTPEDHAATSTALLGLVRWIGTTHLYTEVYRPGRSHHEMQVDRDALLLKVLQALASKVDK